ncbi:MAG: hypothetical protein IJ056_01070 [Acidaminococcaceae bacterium]|nr:hypothetical protein [Acidaminococcaceae bacterium]
MAGAASFFLSIKEAKVILDSPMWCSSITELRLRGAGISCDRLYSLFIEDEDLIFGCKKKLLQALCEAAVNTEDRIVCVAVNCGPALVGDDIEGICSSEIGSVPVAVADAGGFTGEFDDGYAKALMAVLKLIKYRPGQTAKHTVNILGFSPVERHAAGLLQELVRILAICGIKVNLVIGEMGQSVDALPDIGRAEYNIVLNKTRALEAAEWLKQALGQPFVCAGVPYGVQGCREWIDNIASLMGIRVPEQVETELKELQKEIFKSKIQHFRQGINIERCILSGSPDRILPIAKAVREEWKKIPVYVNIYDREEAHGFYHWDFQVKLPKLKKGELQIVIGTEMDRIILGEFEKTIFVSTDDITDTLRTAKETFAGIRGWAVFMEKIFSQYRQLTLIFSSGNASSATGTVPESQTG